MKTLIAVTLLAVSCAFNAVAQRVDTKVLSGQTSSVKDDFTRLDTPVFVLNSLLYIVTNNSDGVIFVRTNATVLVHIGLPNPTNNVGRRFEVTTMGASTAVLTNRSVTGSFTDAFTITNSTTSYFIESNKTAVAYSTGTNYIVRLH